MLELKVHRMYSPGGARKGGGLQSADFYTVPGLWVLSNSISTYRAILQQITVGAAFLDKGTQLQQRVLRIVHQSTFFPLTYTLDKEKG